MTLNSVSCGPELDSITHQPAPFLLSASLLLFLPTPAVYLHINPLGSFEVSNTIFSFSVFNLSLIGISTFQLHKEFLCGFIAYADKSFGKRFLLLQQTALWRTVALATKYVHS